MRRQLVNTTTPAVRGTVYGVILNDRDSLARMGGLLEDAPYKGAPMSPPLYLKPANTVVGDGARVRLPAGATAVEVGATLGVRFNRPAARLTAAEAPAVIAGYVVVADLSLPHSSYYRPAIREKCFDGACPVGARLVSPADAGELARVVINTWIDGELAQSRCLAELVRDVPTLISEVSHFMTLGADDMLLVGVRWQAAQAGLGAQVRVEAGALGEVNFALAAEQELA
jgi:5-oxopent-3-ene-1,2,5-tricarboxylate decarboxylase/2-hydroxyhepta-2,4-diene-1,7-dioate isomerase